MRKAAACDPGDGGRGTGAVVAALRCHVSQRRPSVDSAGEVAAGAVAAALYSIRSERLLMEEIDYSVLFRWFVGLNLDEEVWDATTFTKNRDRLLQADVAKEFLAQVVAQAQSQGFTSVRRQLFFPLALTHQNCY